MLSAYPYPGTIGVRFRLCLALVLGHGSLVNWGGRGVDGDVVGE
jgi:hypothetical protein